MKRDMNTIRDILLKIEETPRERLDFLEPPTGCSYTKMTEHLIMLDDAGFIEGQLIVEFQARRYLVHKITWDGHDYLETIRNTEVWNQVQEKLKPVGGDFAFEVVKELAITVGRSLISGER